MSQLPSPSSASRTPSPRRLPSDICKETSRSPPTSPRPRRAPPPPPPVKGMNKPYAMPEEEDQDVLQLFGVKCQSLATAKVWVYISKNFDHTNWEKQQEGMACVIKDDQHQSFYIRVFSTEQNTLLWEMEMKPEFNYKTLGPCFYTFQNCQTGLNFMDSKEAEIFKCTIEDKMKYIRERWRHPQDSKEPRKNVKKEKKEKVNKLDIGTPTNFRHICHVGSSGEEDLQFSYFGLDPKDFESDTSNQDLQQFIDKFGLTKEELRDRQTRELISDFIFKHGGIKTALEESSVSELWLPKTPPPETICQTPNNPNLQMTTDCTDSTYQFTSTESAVTEKIIPQTKVQTQPMKQQWIALQGTAQSLLIAKTQSNLGESKPTMRPKPTPRENLKSPKTMTPEPQPRKSKPTTPTVTPKPSPRDTRQLSPTVTPHTVRKESKETTPTVTPKPSPRSTQSSAALEQKTSSTTPQPAQRNIISSSPTAATQSSTRGSIHPPVITPPQPAPRRTLSKPTSPN